MRRAYYVIVGPYDDGLRDPGYEAVVGIYFARDVADPGHLEKAGTFLQAAVDAGVDRPNAYIELARVRYIKAVMNPKGKHLGLSRDQVEPILDLFRRSPATLKQKRTWLDIVEVLRAADGPPTDRDMALLEKCRDLHPGQGTEEIMAEFRKKVDAAKLRRRQ